jgi:hypothetical protein
LPFGSAKNCFIEIKYSFFLFRVFVEVPDGVEHEVVGEGTVGGDGAALGVDEVVGRRELVEEVKAIEAEDELAYCYGLADGGVDDEVVAVEGGCAITATALHLSVSDKGESSELGAP